MALMVVNLPDSFVFLQPGWWALHVVAITTVFLIGYGVGARSQRR